MTRFKIRESEVRQYVRSLIREAIESEGRKPDPINKRELDKMRRGEDFNFGIMGSGAQQTVRDYFRDNGIPFPTKPKGGNPITIINGATGEDKSPNNTEDAISYKHEKQRQKRNQIRLDKYHETKNKDKIDQMRQMVYEPLVDDEDIDDENDDTSTDTSKKERKANDALSNDEYTQKWLSMSEEEREAMRDKIRRNRIKERSAENTKFRSSMQRGVNGTYPTAKELKQQIADLKDKQAMLGQHNDINDKKWREYDFLINDREKILNKYYRGYRQSSKEEDTDDTTNIIQKDEYEPLDNFYNRSGKKRDFQGLKDLGFYDDDDYDQ